MTAPRRSEATAIVAPPLPAFSIVHGGPVFQLTQRAHLCGPALEFVPRRILAAILVAWLPLLVLSLLEGSAFAGSVAVPFLRDVEAHVRFLIAMPMLIAAELVVDVRISPLIRRFVDRRLVEHADLPAFIAAVRATVRAYDSAKLEAALVVVVYTLGLWLWQNHIALTAGTWYARPLAGRVEVSAAGYWNALVSIPMFQFLLLRWYARIVLWFRLLWRISRLNLRLCAAHPDLAGGLGFLGKSTYAFTPILCAQGALLSGLIANRVLYGGQALTSFTVEAGCLIGVMILFILGPLVMFTPKLDAAKRKGGGAFGVLASRYVLGFEDKWIRARGMDRGDLLGSSDIQSLADLANSNEVIRKMRLVPFGKDDVIRLVAVTAAPLLPLGLTIYPLQELVTRVLRLLL